MSNTMVNDEMVTSKGQVTLPKNGNTVRVVDSAAYALQKFQQQMKGQAESAGFLTEEEVAEWITKSRRGEK